MQTNEKAATVAALIKRGTPSAWPHELTVATSAADPLCDVERMELPVTDERVLNFAIRGQLQPVLVRARGDEIVVVAGRQRWKRATVINHLVGVHIYRGALKSVREAIDRLRGSDAGKRIMEECPKGMKLQFTLHRGDEKDAVGSIISENEQRDGDDKVVKIRRAQRLARQGFSAEDQAADAGVSVATMRRWMATDLDNPKGKKARGKATRPSAKKIAAVALRAGTGRARRTDVAVALSWANGKCTDGEFFDRFPDLGDEAPAALNGTGEHAEAAE